jgi:hypothetical protein
MDVLPEGSNVLYLWNGEMTSDIEKNVNEIKSRKFTVNVENAGRLEIGNS